MFRSNYLIIFDDCKIQSYDMIEMYCIKTLKSDQKMQHYLELAEHLGACQELHKALALQHIKKCITLYHQCSQCGLWHGVRVNVLVPEFLQGYQVRGKTSINVFMDLLVQHLLCLCNMHQGCMCNMVWHSAQLHTMFSTSSR